jgi:dTDP-4-dehydrorhamnose reductase
MTTSFIVTGRNGQLGRCLQRSLAASEGVELRAAFDHRQLDIADRDAVMRLFDAQSEGPPSWLVNAAAYTAVDACESEVEASRAVNDRAPGYLAEACAEAGVRLVHVSTDYVFNGESEAPYGEDAAPDPRTEYGRGKLAGEGRVLTTAPEAWVIRTAWVFGPGKNFVGAILRQALLRELGKASGPLRVVDDQYGCPTYAADLAEAIVCLTTCEAARNESGLLHLSNAERCTWWDFARAILDATGYASLEIDRGTTAELNTAAVRPHYSVLDCSRAESLGVTMRSWRAALDAYLACEDGEQLLADARAQAEAA